MILSESSIKLIISSVYIVDSISYMNDYMKKHVFAILLKILKGMDEKMERLDKSLSLKEDFFSS